MYDGSTWTTIDIAYYDNIAVANLTFVLSGLYTGYSNVRVLVDNYATSDTSMDYDGGSFKAVLGKTEVNLLGIQVATTEDIYSKFGDGNAVIGGNLTITKDMFLEGDAFKTGGGSWDTLSDGSTKNDYGVVEEGVDYLEFLGRAHWYTYKDDYAPPINNKFAGFDARFAGNLAKYRTIKGEKLATFDWNTHQAVLHNAVIELSEEVKRLRKELAEKS
jgi:hypothetical protein